MTRSTVTRSGLKRPLKRGNFRLSWSDQCGCVVAVRTHTHTVYGCRVSPLISPSGLASRWHPYATLISALENCGGIKIACEDHVGCVCLRVQRRRSERGEKKKDVTRLRDVLKRLGVFRGNFLLLSHTNEINTFCQSQLLPKQISTSCKMTRGTREIGILWRTSMSRQLFWTFLHFL